MILSKWSRGTRLLAAGAAVAAIGLGSGGWAYAASSGGTPAPTPASCSGLTLTPVPGVSAPPVSGIENPTPVAGTPVVCGDEGTTAG